MRIAVLVNRSAFNQLHHQVRNALVGRPSIEQPRNIRMIERCENLPLMPEPFQNRRRIVPTPHQLDRYFLFVLPIGTARTVHLTHSSVTDLFQNVVCTNPASHTA